MGDAVFRKEHRKADVRALVLIPLSITIVAIIVSFSAVLYWYESAEISMAAEEVFRAAPRALDEEAGLAGGEMESVLAALEGDDVFAGLFETRDMAGVRKRMAPLFERLKRAGIGHFYLMDAKRVCLLRMHNPGRRGDVIDRFTVLEAGRTGRTAAGQELGPLGTFSLRVVKPWRRRGRLLGYVELGCEMAHLGDHLHEALGLENAVVIFKEFLERDSWLEGMRMLSRKADWDAHPEAVLAGSSLPSLPEGAAAFFGRRLGAVPTELLMDGRRLAVGSRDLRDAGGRIVGRVVFFKDMTLEYDMLRWTVAKGVALCLVVGGLLFWLLFLRLRDVDETLDRQAAGLLSARDFLQSVLDAIPRKITVVGLDYKVRMANRLAAQEGGMSGKDVSCHELSHRSDRPCSGDGCPCPLERVVATRSPVVMTHIHEDAARRKAAHEVIAAPILDGSGRVTEVVMISQDLSRNEPRIDLSGGGRGS